MKAKSLFIGLIILCTTQTIKGQATIEQNNPIFGNEYLGWDADTPFPLYVRHYNNKPIVFETNGIQRMRLEGDGRFFVGNVGSALSNSLMTVHTDAYNIGLRSIASGNNLINQGGTFRASGAQVNIGVRGYAVDQNALYNYGVAGIVCGDGNNYAVYGAVCDSNNYAGFFNGNVYASGSYSGSDANLKTDIEDLTGATELLAALLPKKYYYSQEIDALNLPGGLQFGLIAQDVKEVLPQMVRTIHAPPRIGEEGELLSEGLDFLGLRYDQLIPLLVAGFQEQSTAMEVNQNEIESLIERLNSVEQDLSKLPDETMEAGDARQFIQKDKGVPNPFSDHTSIHFDLTERAQVKLIVTDLNGSNAISVHDGVLDPGKHAIPWNSAALAPGVYFYTIYANGEIATGKLIKQKN